MLTQRIASLLKFLIGIFVLQGATALVTYTALQTEVALTWPLFAAVGASTGFLVALWFESISGGIREQALSRLDRRYAREREKIRLQAERDKARMAVKHTKTRGHASGKLKTGIAVGGMVGVGVAMMLAQFMTLGLLTVSTAGGAALGYGLRVRQEKRLRARLDSDMALALRDDARFDALEEMPAHRMRVLPRGKGSSSEQR